MLNKANELKTYELIIRGALNRGHLKIPMIACLVMSTLCLCQRRNNSQLVFHPQRCATRLWNPPKTPFSKSTLYRGHLISCRVTSTLFYVNTEINRPSLVFITVTVIINNNDNSSISVIIIMSIIISSSSSIVMSISPGRRR